jgi:hypothetical protein
MLLLGEPFGFEHTVSQFITAVPVVSGRQNHKPEQAPSSTTFSLFSKNCDSTLQLREAGKQEMERLRPGRYPFASSTPTNRTRQVSGQLVLQ